MHRLVTCISSRFLFTSVFEPSVESLKVQVTIEEIRPCLCTAKVILLSIMRALTPYRYCKDMTQTIAEKAAMVAAQISKLVETAEESPQLLDNITQLEKILRNIHRFVQSETQWKFHFREDLPARCSYFDASLAALLNAFQLLVSKPGLPLEDKAIFPTGQQTRSTSDTPHNASHFSGAHHFIINGGIYNNIFGNYVAVAETADEDSSQTSKGIVEGSRVFAVEDVFPERQIYKGAGYRLYSAQTSSKIIAMKVYEGKNAKERCWEAARFYQKVVHPNIPHMIGVSPLKSEQSFLIFDGNYEGTVDYMLGQALKEGLQQSLIMGMKTVAALSSGLDYLHDLSYPFGPLGLDHFILLSCKGRVIISFDPEDLGHINQSDEQFGEPYGAHRAVEVFHGLCQKTFDAASKAHYESQQMQRIFVDVDDSDAHSDEDDFPDNRFEEVDDAAQLLDSSNGLSPSNAHAVPSPRRKSLRNGRRQELIWKPKTAGTVTLDDISRQFQEFLITHPLSSKSALNRRRGRQTARTAHRCPGYSRIEITLTSDITRNAIVFNSTPIPHEICPVCKEVVKDAEIFNCICGDDDESMPTVRCSACSEWHHQLCANFFASENQSFFVCQRCQVGPQRSPQSPLPSVRDIVGHSGVSSGFDMSEFNNFAQSKEPPTHIGQLWYLNVHTEPPYLWERCQALLYPRVLLLSWLAPGGRRGIVTLDLLNCTSVQSAPSPTHPSARDDVGTIAARQQSGEPSSQPLMDMLVPFHMSYTDGVERLAAEIPLEREEWVNRLWEAVNSGYGDQL